MHYLTKEDQEKLELNEKLFIKLTELQSEHLRICKNYDTGNATEDEVIKIKAELEKTNDEWRSTLVLFKKVP